MNPGETSDLSVWVIPPGNKPPCRLRLNRLRLVLVVSVLVAVISGLTLFFGNYYRLQFLLFRSRAAVSALNGQTGNLLQQRAVLHNKISRLREDRQRLLLTHNDTRRKLNNLLALMGGGAGAPKRYAADGRGMGGLEVEPAGRQTARGKAGALYKYISPPSHMGPEYALRWLLRTVTKIPLARPGSSEVNSGYGLRKSPFDSRLALHKGLDLAMAYGDKVLVTANGVVTAVKRNRTYGLVIDVAHGEHIVTRYAHLATAAVMPGKRVKQGEVIGRVGTTGATSGVHLHYEVLVDNESIDPGILFDLAARIQSLLL